jgi:hypothetical protein
VHGERPQDPEIAAATGAFFAQQGIVLGPVPPIVVGWQLQLRIDGVEVERREFAGSEAGYQEANHAGGTWMAQHGVDSSMQWLVQSAQALQRMTWDEDYRREVGRRIS